MSYVLFAICAVAVIAWARNMRRLHLVLAAMAVLVAADLYWPRSAEFCSRHYEACVRSGLANASGPFGQFFGWLIRSTGLG